MLPSMFSDQSGPPFRSRLVEGRSTVTCRGWSMTHRVLVGLLTATDGRRDASSNM